MAHRAYQHIPDQSLRSLWAQASLPLSTREKVLADRIPDPGSVQVRASSTLSRLANGLLVDADHDNSPSGICDSYDQLHPGGYSIRGARHDSLLWGRISQLSPAGGNDHPSAARQG